MFLMKGKMMKENETIVEHLDEEQLQDITGGCLQCDGNYAAAKAWHTLDERELGTVTGGRRLPLSQPSSAPARPPSPAPGSDAQLLRDMPLVNTQPGLRRSDSMPNLRSMGSPNLENPEAAAEIARHFIENHTVQPR